MAGKRDIFLCHAGEDKAKIIRPLADALRRAGVSTWLDEAEIKWGDSVTGKVNEGLASSEYVLVVLSPAFLNKPWPKRELNAALNLEASSGKVRVLPLLVGSDEEIEETVAKLPLLNDKYYLEWTSLTEPIVAALLARLGRQGAQPAPESESSTTGRVLAFPRDSLVIEQAGGLAERALKEILQDQFTSGSEAGGWGKAYETRYFGDLFDDSLPKDSLVHPHSISFSLWVLEGLKAAFEDESPLRDWLGWSPSRIKKLFAGIADYYRRHFDEQTGGVGPRWSGIDAAGQVAPNVRHASSGLVAFSLLHGFLQEASSTSHYIIGALRTGRPYENARALSVASILRALYFIRNTPTLSQGLFADDLDLEKLIAQAELELLSRYDRRANLWDVEQPAAERASIWYSVFVLRSVPALQESTNEVVRQLYRECLTSLLESRLVKTGAGVGLPYTPEGDADVGMTASLINILLQDRLLEEGRKSKYLKANFSFLIENYNNPPATRFTYSWTWSMVLLALVSSGVILSDRTERQ